MSSGQSNSTSLLRYYSKLRDHRCNLVEGIRIIAFRNADHLSRVMTQLNLDDMGDAASVTAAQNRMLDDQRLEKNDTNRWLMDGATWIPWEIYICLLYAEFESYIKVSRTNQQLAYGPLEEYISSHERFIQSLKNVRDKLLHPMKDVDYKESLEQVFDTARQTSPGFQVEFVESQNHIDDYLEWLRELCVEHVIEKADAMSDRQILEHRRNRPQAIIDLLGRSVDSVEGEHLQHLLKRESEVQGFLSSGLDAVTALTPQEQHELSTWQDELLILALPVPERHVYDPDAIQTPIHAELSSFLPFSMTENQPALKRLPLPEYLGRRRSGFSELLFRSLILLNEPYTIMQKEVLASFPNKSRVEVIDDFDRLLPNPRRLESMTNYKQLTIKAAPFLVSLALLNEPLRLYKEASAKRSELKDVDLEHRIGKEALNSFSRFRNTVFHVPDNRTDAPRAEDEFYENASALLDYRKLLVGCFVFLE